MKTYTLVGEQGVKDFKNKIVMKTIKLEVGKTYRNRKGEEVKIVENDGGVEIPYKGSDGKWYAENGTWGYGEPEDLIEEVKEAPATRHTFAIPDGVKEITLAYFGNRIVVETVPEETEPKPGDVMVNDMGSVYIFKEVYGSYHKDYAWLGEDGRLVIEGTCYSGRPATVDEAKPLFDALKKAGKRWNAETIEVEDLPESDRIMDFLKGYVSNATWTYQQLCWLIEAYLKHRS